jgi:hypothetical protein
MTYSSAQAPISVDPFAVIGFFTCYRSVYDCSLALLEDPDRWLIFGIMQSGSSATILGASSNRDVNPQLG